MLRNARERLRLWQQLSQEGSPLCTAAALSQFFSSPWLLHASLRGRRSASPDAEHAEQTLAVGTVALETSKLAMAKDDWVKRFAGYEVAEQTMIAEKKRQKPSTSSRSHRISMEIMSRRSSTGTSVF